MNDFPPGWQLRFLRWFCRTDHLEEIEGDLYEMFSNKLSEKGVEYARRTFLFDVLKFFRWSNLKIPKRMKGINFTLFVRSVKYALKQYKINLGHSVINSIGLAIGISTFITLMAYTYQQLIYDKNYEDGDQIFRLVTEKEVADNIIATATSAVPLLPNLSGRMKDIQSAARMYPYPCFISTDVQKKYREAGFVFADSSLFSVFNFSMIQGNPQTALNGPLKVVITEKMAIKYFGDKSPMGKKLSFEDDSEEADFTVTGVIENLPENTHLKGEFFASIQSLEQIMPWYNNWHYPHLYTYVKLNTSDTTTLTGSLEKFLRTHTPEHYHSQIASVKFQSVESIHLESDYENDWKANSSLVYVRIFIIVGVLILFIAIVNYVNLVVSRGVVRSKEVGMRKVVGADKQQLIFQFMTEAFTNVMIAVILSVALVKFISVLFRLNMGLSLDYSFIAVWPYSGILVGLFFLLVILTGFYPALVMSRFRPLDSFRQKLPTSGSSLLRKGLVFMQFAISGTMILVTVLIMTQSKFLQSKNLGFDVSHLVAIKMVDENDAKNYEVFKQMLLAESFVESAAISSTFPGDGNYSDFDASSTDQEDIDPISMKTLGVDEDFLTTYQMKLIAGRDFNKEIKSDETGAFILNQAASEKFGWKDPIDKDFKLVIYTGGRVERVGKVIGLTEDFHFESLYKEIEPLVIYINKHRYYTEYLNVRLRPGNLVEQVDRLEELYTSFNTNKPFEFAFVNDELDRQYENEVRQGSVMSLFSIIAIILSCLGILGLITYATQRKAKEVGIRKIMGSSRIQIFYLFIKEYIRLFIPAILVSGLIVYFFSERWLSNFAYSIDFSLLYYILGFAALALIALLTISYHTIRASGLNPVDCLRDE